MNKRPLSVVIISCVFVAAGAFGLVYHALEFSPQGPFDSTLGLVLFVRLLAIIGGIFTLRGANWARWLLLAWIAYHVILSGFHSLFELIIHALLFGAVAYALFRPRAAAYFHGATTESG